MRKLKPIFFVITLSMVAFGCDKGLGEFLDKPPGADVTEATIFSSQTQLESFVAACYRLGMHSYLAMNENITSPPANSGAAYRSLGRPFTINAGMTDEAEGEETFFHVQAWNAAPNAVAEDYRWTVRWTAIRNCNIIIERIDEVPGLSETDKNRIIGEVKFIRALNHFEMLKRYGGVPIADRRIEATEKLPRNTVAEVIDFVVANCDDAIDLLPDTYPANQRGRVTKTAAHMLKSRTLLFAASPQFNTGNPPLGLGDTDTNALICLGNEDNSRWQLAADAAKAAIEAAPAGGFALIEDQGPDKNYKYVWEQPDNKEIVLAEKLVPTRSRTQFPFYGMWPNHMVNAWGGVLVTHTFVMKYEKRDGTPQTWDMVNGGDDLQAKYAELDYRFAQTVGYNRSFFNANHPSLQNYAGGGNNPNGRCRTGAWMKKFLPDLLSTQNPNAVTNGMIFRLAEAYLNYAEALNEAQGPVQEAYDAVNRIRVRSGQPELIVGDYTKETLREKIRNERALEFAFEDYRMWDVRRWLIAEEDGVMNGDMWGLRIFTTADPNEFRYEPYVFETRTFNKNMYLHPFLQSEVNKGYLVQNPGW